MIISRTLGLLLLLSRRGHFGWFVACKIATIPGFGRKERICALWCYHRSFSRQQTRENERHRRPGRGQKMSLRLVLASLVPEADLLPSPSFVCSRTRDSVPHCMREEQTENQKTAFVKGNNI